MKILFLPAYFHPEVAASGYLGQNRAEAFARQGYDMEVYAPTPTRGVSPEIRREYKKRRTETLHNGRMTVHRFAMFGEGRYPLMRALRYALCCARQFQCGCVARNVDLMWISSTPPIQGAMAALIKKITRVPFVYNLQDIFPDSLVSTGLARRGSIVWKIGRAIEDFTYRNADRIIVISEGFKRNIMAKGVPEEKIRVIYNWVDESAVVHVDRSANKLFDKYKLDRAAFYVTYCGNIGLTQNMPLLLEVAEELQAVRDLKFVLVGEGACRQEVEALIAERKLANVVLLPFQPCEDLSHVFSLGDAGLVLSKTGVGENSVPSKTWSIMSAERPVVASFDENELKDILVQNQCGLFGKAGDKDALKEGILCLYRDRARARQLGKNGRKFILEHLSREAGTAQSVAVVREFEKNSAAPTLT